VAEVFRRWIADKPPDKPLWAGWSWCDAARMVKTDLEDAGIPYTTKDGVADFHAVGRVFYITNLVQTSAPTALVLRIARLSSPQLLDRYYRPSDGARAEVIAAMPQLV
jgi:hypothetical protein